jgi:hypothetical protein
MSNPLDTLKKVGEAKLKVLFWDVYYSSLYNQTGNYTENKTPLALKIDYLRDINSQDLIKRTQAEWEKLDISNEVYAKWLPLLNEILPDIKKGDSLLLFVDENQHSEFFFNETPTGRISDTGFGLSFLRIWLDKKCSYPLVRDKLVGTIK